LAAAVPFIAPIVKTKLMILKQLLLQNFRSYSQKKFQFSSGITLVIGPNTSGKTNLLEAIYLMSTGKSFRAGLEREMIFYGQENARLEGLIKTQEGEEKLMIFLTTGQEGERRSKKKYLVNGVAKRRMDFVGLLRSVLFRPEDLQIIINSPAKRRGWLDEVLEQTDREYRRANLSYQKGLRQRNKLLEQIREEGKPRSILFFWVRLLFENGQLITQKREELIDFINHQPDDFGRFEIKYEKNLLTPQRLEKYARAEVAAGLTLIGPHRDDFEIRARKNGLFKARSLHTYGSRGEQRIAVFNLKLAELEFVSAKTGTRPVLLLDDIFSELDRQHRARIFKVISAQQTIITAADSRLIEKKDLQKTAKIKLIS